MACKIIPRLGRVSVGRVGLDVDILDPSDPPAQYRAHVAAGRGGVTSGAAAMGLEAEADRPPLAREVAVRPPPHTETSLTGCEVCGGDEDEPQPVKCTNPTVSSFSGEGETHQQ